MVDNGIEEEKTKGAIHPALQKTFIVLAIISYGLGAVVSFYTLKKLKKS